MKKCPTSLVFKKTVIAVLSLNSCDVGTEWYSRRTIPIAEDGIILCHFLLQWGNSPLMASRPIKSLQLKITKKHKSALQK